MKFSFIFLSLTSLILSLPILATETTTTVAEKTETTTMAEKATVLNLSGKQRMLTQKMTKNIFHISHEIEGLHKIMAEFERTLNGLFKGDAQLRLAKTNDPEIVKQLNKVAELWQPFKGNIEAVLAGDISPQRLEKIAQQNMPLLENMNLAVEMYEKAFFSSLEPGMATTLNLAGKQRMLTQKMAKEAELITKGIDIKQNRTQLQETMSLFERTLIGLLQGDKALGLPGTQENTSIYRKLVVVKQLWEEYKPMLERILQEKPFTEEELEKHHVDARRLNSHLLINMHKAVNLYERSVGLRNSSLRQHTQTN